MFCMVCKCFLSFGRLSFHFVGGLPFSTEAFQFDVAHLLIFAFVAFAFEVRSKKFHVNTDTKELIAYIFFLEFLWIHVLCLSCNPFKFDFFVCGTIFMSLQVSVQFSKLPLKRLPFLFYILDSFVINYLSMNIWVYFQTLYSLPLIYVSVFMPLPLLS